MRFDKPFLDDLTEQAKKSPRQRMNYDLRDSVEDASQKMLNALEPGTILPIHRHRGFSEVVVLLRGKAVQYIYDEKGNVMDEIRMAAGSDCPGMVVEKGAWHRLESLESGTIIVESKNGAYVPISNDDILNVDK
ncbi:MAG: WbuC family cupin fold metalloprotein [Paludibacteraceae bacterium]|nr:WbuC family cupin fold metalloprotein [Paludibacteraceae bacterium]